MIRHGDTIVIPKGQSGEPVKDSPTTLGDSTMSDVKDSPMSVTYGGKPATAYWDGDRRRLSVHLETDPGTGPMSFHRIAPSAVTLVNGTPADTARMVERLREESRYLTPGGPGAARLAGMVDILTAAHSLESRWCEARTGEWHTAAPRCPVCE
jgi:hypothetical protein